MLTLAVFRIPTDVRAWIEDVVVDEAARSRGVGRALTQLALDLAEAEGPRTVELTSRPTRMAAHRLYTQMGAQLQARRPGPARAARARRQNAGGSAPRRHSRRPPRRLAAYKAARGGTWEPGEPAFLNARGKRWTRDAIAQHVIPPALEEANRQRARADSRPSPTTSPRTRCGTPASPRSSPRAPIRSTSPPRSGTKTSPRPTASTAMCCGGASVARSADTANWRCTSLPRRSGRRKAWPDVRERVEPR
jgi:Acetyltransferase (GNAT) family